MSEAELKRKPDDSNVTEFTEKLKCAPFNSEAFEINIEMSEHEYNHYGRDHGDGIIRQAEPSTKICATDASEDEVEDDEEDLSWKTKSKNIRYIFFDGRSCDEISSLVDYWKMNEQDIFFSVLSESECDNDADKTFEVTETKPTDSVQNIKKLICSSLVEAAATTNAWIITGGQNKGVDQLIGNEVKQRLANRDKIPKAVLGISKWKFVAKKTNLLSDSLGPNGDESDIITTGFGLNQHHTHFILVDDGTQKSGCADTLRQLVEENLSRPLIYVLVGGRINAFSVVKRALANKHPVIIAMGTGGAADIISEAVLCKDGALMEHLPEIAEKLFIRLEKLLIEERIPATEVKTTTNELLAGIKDLLITKQTSSDGSNHSAANAGFDTVNRMCVVIEQMLVANGVPQENAEQAADKLEPEVVNEALAKVKLVFSELKAILSLNQKDLLINFDITSKEKNTISTLIVEALMKAKRNQRSDLYFLVTAWDSETFFRQLLQDNWMRRDHEKVFTELLTKGKTKYVKLMMEHISKRTWLTKSGGPLEKDFEKNNMYKKLLKKIKEAGSDTDNKDERYRLKGKMLFIWCVLKQMRETALLFWEQGQDCLAMALVAYYESKKKKQDLVNNKGYDEMEEQMQFFGKLALDFMSKCHANNQDHTLNVLFGKVVDLDNIVPYDIAIKSNFERFFCVDAMQDLANDVWVGEIENHTKYNYVPLLLAEACPLFAPLLDIRLKEDKIADDKKQGSKTVQICKLVRNYFEKVDLFMDTPIVKFTHRFISYIAYLTLFSIVMLTDFRTKISPSEIALTIWRFILVIEEVKQVKDDISAYTSNGWNYCDIGTLLLYIIGFILRMIYHGDPTICPDCLYVARIILAFSLMVSFFRVLQFLSIFDAIGPTIYMIRHLVSDLVSFLLILAVFISAYGVVSNVILYPNQPLNAQLLTDVFYDAWWSVIQQFNRDDASGSNCNKNNVSAIFTAEYCSNTSDDNIDYVRCKENRCPANNWIVLVLLSFYALLTCIMLLNVLIAMFNATFSTITSKQKDVSKLQRYQLMYEYYFESKVPPPLCVITYPLPIIKYFRDQYRNKCGLSRIECPTICNDKKDAERGETDYVTPWQAWELGIAAEFYTENKDKDEKQRWPVARMQSETSNKVVKNPWMRFIILRIRNQMKVEQSSEETDSHVVIQETRANPESPAAIDATEKKGN